jgi:beta-aspartyl-dipeptidase (metallo-type)
MPDSVILVRNARLYAPEDRGAADLLLAGGRIVAIAPRIEPGRGLDVVEIDAAGRLAVPGFVDSLVHVSGGGGEGGFGTRTPALQPAHALAAGVTTLVGALGTDDVTRSHADLLASCRALAAHGLSAYALTGSYRVPVRTLTGSVRDDLVLVPDFIGVGEIAIADHRGSQPNADELARIAADARVGGLLAGKRGTVLVHVGDSEEGLALLHEVTTRHAVPASQWHPTHLNRNRGLLDQAAAWVARGGSVDLTTSTSEALLDAGEVPAADALVELLRAGLPVARISLSSDGQASLPHFDADGRLLGLEVAAVASLHASLVEAVTRHGMALEAVLPALTATPAAIWGLPRKGRLAVGADADLLLLSPRTFAIEAVIADGRLRLGG